MSAGQIILLTSVAVLWILNCGIIFVSYYYCKNNKNKNGIPLIDEIINEGSMRTDKMDIGEWLLYISYIAIAFYITTQIMKGGNVYFRKEMLLAPIMALFNARKRTGRAILNFLAVATIMLNIFMTYIIIGFPVKAPVLAVNQSEIQLGKTTVSDLMGDGFQVYVKNENRESGTREEILSSGNYDIYSGGASFKAEKGFNIYNDALRYSKYLLVKDNIIIGSFLPYGSEDKEINLEDSKIIQIMMDGDSIKKMKEKGISCKLDSTDLLKPLEQEEMKKNFEKHIWKEPEDTAKDYNDRHYGISFSSNSDSLFWNEYNVDIYLEEDNSIRDFTFNMKLSGK